MNTLHSPRRSAPPHSRGDPSAAVVTNPLLRGVPAGRGGSIHAQLKEPR